MPRTGKLKLVFAAAALAYAVGLLSFCKVIPGWGHWYAPDPQHRDQALAILHGQSELSNSPSDLKFGLCWSQSGVHQVWGLGISFWQLPFALIASLFGQKVYADQLAFGLFLAVTAFAVFLTFFRPLLEDEQNRSAPRNWITAFLSVTVLLVFPPYLSLLQDGSHIYNEVLDYVYPYALLLGCGVIALARSPTWSRFWFISGLAGMGGMVRPTLVFYGLSTVLTAAVIMGILRRGESAQMRKLSLALKLGLGMVLFCLGGVSLWWTNRVRFGDGFEFGHKLILQPEVLLGNIYALRFGYPFEKEPLWRAARELFGALFQDFSLNRTAYYAQGFFPGQSSTLRYRCFTFSTFDLSYFGFVVAGWLGAILSWRRRHKKVLESGCQTLSLDWLIGMWSFVPAAALAFFYLRVPALASRYMMDFAPAFAFAIVLAWRRVAAIVPVKNSLGSWRTMGLSMMFLGWLTWEICGIIGMRNAWSLNYSKALYGRQVRTAEAAVEAMPTSYGIGENLSFWNIPYNGLGWNPENGAVKACIVLFITDPQFVELRFSSVNGAQVTKAEVECMRAKVGLEYLERESITQSGSEWIVRFNGPKRALNQHGLQQLSIATVSKDHFADRSTPWILNHVTWRHFL